MRKQYQFTRHQCNQSIVQTKKVYFWIGSQILSIHTPNIIDTGDVLEITHHTNPTFKIKIVGILDSRTSTYFKTDGKKEFYYELEFIRQL